MGNGEDKKPVEEVAREIIANDAAHASGRPGKVSTTATAIGVPRGGVNRTLVAVAVGATVVVVAGGVFALNGGLGGSNQLAVVTASPTKTPTEAVTLQPTAQESAIPSPSTTPAVPNQVVLVGPVSGTYATPNDCSLVNGPKGEVLNAGYRGVVSGQQVILQLSIRPLHGAGTYPLEGSSTADTYNYMTLVIGVGGTPVVYDGTNGSITVSIDQSVTTASATGSLVSSGGATEQVTATDLVCK